MKKRLETFVSLVLVVVIAVGLAACNSGGGAGAGNPATVQAATTDQAEADQKDQPEAEADQAGAADQTAEADQTAQGQEAVADQAATGKRVYFAGPLFNEAERAYNLKIVSILEAHGYEVFLPQRDGFLAPELEGKTEEEKTEMIFAKDRDEVLKADILFMMLDGRVPDEGACVELGIAYASGKRCYGFKGDARSVELDMDLNPMISGCFIKLFYNLDEGELIKSLEEYLEENEL